MSRLLCQALGTVRTALRAAATAALGSRDSEPAAAHTTPSTGQASTPTVGWAPQTALLRPHSSRVLTGLQCGPRTWARTLGDSRSSCDYMPESQTARQRDRSASQDSPRPTPHPGPPANLRATQALANPQDPDKCWLRMEGSALALPHCGLCRGRPPRARGDDTRVTTGQVCEAGG